MSSTQILVAPIHRALRMDYEDDQHPTRIRIWTGGRLELEPANSHFIVVQSGTACVSYDSSTIALKAGYFGSFPGELALEGQGEALVVTSIGYRSMALLHGQESIAFGDAGYQGIEKRPDAKSDVNWQIAMGPSKRKALNKENEADALIDQAEKIKAGIRAKVEHPFRVIKRQFGFIKVRYKGLKKNTAQLITLFALSNLWMVRTKLMGVGA